MLTEFFKEKQSSIQILSVILFCFILYIPTVYFDFAWDDGDHIINNPLIKSEAFPWQIFKEATHPGNLFRPVFYLTLWLNSFVFGLEPWSFHLVNILLHCLVVLLVQIFIANLTGSKTVSLITAVIFGLSSAQSEVVASVSYRTESLAASFVLLTLISAQYVLSKGVVRYRDLVMLGASAILGMLSKENGITILILIPLLWVFYFGAAKNMNAAPGRLKASVLLPVALALGCYLYLRSQAVLVSAELSSSTSVFDNVLIGQDITARIIKALYFQGIYLFNLLVPHPIFNDYSFANVSATFEWTPVEISFVALALGFLFLGVANFKKRNLIGFGVAWYFLAFSLTGNFVNLIGTHFANRLTYLPSIGLYLIVGSIFARLASHQYLRYLCLAYVVFMSLITSFQVTAWQNNRALSEFDLGLGTKSARIYHSLATVSFREGKLKAAEEYEQKAIQIHPEFWPSHLFLTKLYLTIEDFDRAEDSLRRYRELRPNSTVELESEGWIKFGRGEFEGALLIFDRLRSYDSASDGALLGYYCAAKAVGADIEVDKIAQAFSERIKKDPRYIKCSKAH